MLFDKKLFYSYEDIEDVLNKIRYFKVKKIINADRVVGYGGVRKPPKYLLGKTIIVTRPLINWNGYWVCYIFKRNGKIMEREFVVSEEEICDETNLKKIERIKTLYREYWVVLSKKEIAEKL